MDPTELIVAWLENTSDVRDALGEGEGFADVDAVREHLEARIRKEGDLRKIRDDLVRYATQYAPKEIGDLKGFLDWSLSRVDWHAVRDAVVRGGEDAPATLAPRREAAL